MKRSAYLTSNRVQALADLMSFRDWEVVQTLDKLRLAQARQLQRLHFTEGSPLSQARQCRRALERLTALGIVIRLDRVVGGVRGGSAAHVYSLSVGGLKLAGRLGRTNQRRAQKPTTPGIAFLGHRLAISELFVRLTEAERRRQLELLSFQAEPDCWRRFVGPGGGRAWAKPDAFVELGIGPAFIDSYFVEVDRGTQSSTALKQKCIAYRRYAATGREQERSSVFPQVLFLVPTEARKAFVVDVLTSQPPDSWNLFRVGLFDEAVDVFAQGEEE
jgi:hypothetical protein